MWHSNPIIVVFDWRDVMIGALAEHVTNPVDLANAILLTVSPFTPSVLWIRS